ncbi:hypothetical protein WECO103172_04025 [Weissella confusa]|uniref:hypothetical protein n=2 Tax=Weissella confusa TaxID=1583 RepID=UPI000704D8CC|nr:hypothetical protein [Weissella confusa]KRN23713.1 hypothetical protein IV69_GL001273 [Weissella confusa]MBJ7698563.1 hypothetical protein [Weissella confusa]MBS7550839.1 hypothetical protein [Weissella confusa]MCQ8096684.1 hypothetical protein [Weissella confusa]MCQ8145908.1 hypothetical protein [Weissella confusa]
MLNQKQIIIEWQKAGLKENGFMFQDITNLYELAVHNADSDEEANKLIILAIRAAAKNGGKTAMAVENNLNKWMNAGATNAMAVGEYESKAKQIQKTRYGNQPLKFESGPSKPTAEQIDQQNQRMAKELGYASVEDMAKGTADKLSELRQTRPERLDDKPANGRTANGRRVLQRF